MSHQNQQEAAVSAIFPSAEWLQELDTKLNSDEKYADIAKNWEGDLIFYIEPNGNLKEQLTFYLDLWHGKCRGVEYQPKGTPGHGTDIEGRCEDASASPGAYG